MQYVRYIEQLNIMRMVREEMGSQKGRSEGERKEICVLERAICAYPAFRRATRHDYTGQAPE